jgi:hypothetical protein
MEDTTLEFHELVGELRELTGRVVALELRDADGNLIVRPRASSATLPARGRSSSEAGSPPGAEGVRFIVAAWVVCDLRAGQLANARRTSTGVGVPFVLHVRTTSGVRISLWPAMPPEEQWTDLHEQNR